MTTLQAIRWENGKLEILDQILLPAISRYIPVRGVEDGWKVINNMQVRVCEEQRIGSFSMSISFVSNVVCVRDTIAR